MFQVGQYVVKANTGVCKVMEIIMRAMSEEEEEREYYVLSPYLDMRSKLFVPVDSCVSNIRCILTKEEAEAFLSRIPEIGIAWIESDRLREQHYQDAIKSNDPERLVSVIKNLYLRNKQREQQGKKSTAVDERYFKMAEGALYTELAVAMDRNPEELRGEILGFIDCSVG